MSRKNNGMRGKKKWRKAESRKRSEERENLFLSQAFEEYSSVICIQSAKKTAAVMQDRCRNVSSSP